LLILENPIERAYNRLSSGQIHKKAGFYNECSVSFSTEKRIRVSQSICNDGEDLNQSRQTGENKPGS
jgi:hypothetical protein